jgi:hypothetical protein
MAVVFTLVNMVKYNAVILPIPVTEVAKPDSADNK